MGDNLNTSSPWLRLGFVMIILDGNFFGVASFFTTTCDKSWNKRSIAASLYFWLIHWTNTALRRWSTRLRLTAWWPDSPCLSTLLMWWVRVLHLSVDGVSVLVLAIRVAIQYWWQYLNYHFGQRKDHDCWREIMDYLVYRLDIPSSSEGIMKHFLFSTMSSSEQLLSICSN